MKLLNLNPTCMLLLLVISQSFLDLPGPSQSQRCLFVNILIFFLKLDFMKEIITNRLDTKPEQYFIHYDLTRKILNKSNKK